MKIDEAIWKIERILNAISKRPQTTGISIVKSKDVKIRNSIIEGFDRGITIEESEAIEAIRNKIASSKRPEIESLIENILTELYKAKRTKRIDKGTLWSILDKLGKLTNLADFILKYLKNSGIL
ncbi:MAG: hypothetical protein ACTSQ8_26645 [Candidatus Helarchaeota archaeon]